MNKAMLMPATKNIFIVVRQLWLGVPSMEWRTPGRDLARDSALLILEKGKMERKIFQAKKFWANFSAS